MAISEIKKRTRKLIREYAPKLFLIVLIYVLITTVLGELQYRLPNTSSAFDRLYERLMSGGLPDGRVFLSSVRPLGSALAFLIMLVTPVINVGFMNYCLRISRDINGDYKDLFDGFAYFLKILLMVILMGIFIFLWSLLLIFPGIIAAYRYRMAYYILLDNPEKSVMDCIRQSKRLMAGKKLELFLLDLSFIGWVVLDILITLWLPFSLPIVALWLNPYSGISYATFYNQLIGYVSPSLSIDEDSFGGSDGFDDL